MAEYDLKKSIPRENFNIQGIFNRPSLTNPNMIVVGDPYIDFTKNEKTYSTRNFNHSELVGDKIKYKTIGGFEPSAGKSFTGVDLDIDIYYHERNHNYSSTNLRNRIVSEHIHRKT